VQRFVRERGSRFDPQRGTTWLPVMARRCRRPLLRARFQRGAAGFGHGRGAARQAER
jgi:hypothetical protein